MRFLFSLAFRAVAAYSRWRKRRTDPLIKMAESMVQKSGALSPAFRRDPCAPGGCRLLQATTCPVCSRRLYECESVRIGLRVPRSSGPACASCEPFRGPAPDGWAMSEVCSHGTPLWQKCTQCEQRPAPQPLDLERS